jgi:hypothetical protein
MSEDKRTDSLGNDSELMAKIEKLEAMFSATEQARKRAILIARISVFVILGALVIFAINLWNFANAFRSKENMTQLTSRIATDLKDVMTGQQMKKIQDKLYKETLPKVTTIFLERFKKEMPVFQDAGTKVLSNLQEHVEMHLKLELTKMLEDSLKDIEKDLLKQNPNLNPEKLHDTIMGAKEVFIEEVTGALEERLISLTDKFNKIEAVAKKYNETAEYKALEGKPTEEIQANLVAALLELAAYEVKPEKGEKKVTLEGGVK